jgi:Helix-turn-helix domain
VNVIPRPEAPIDASVWQSEPMRHALATHALATVCRMPSRVGVPQRRIGALTGQSQSEVSEILAGRQVQSHAVLTRIADGFGLAPRGARRGPR